MDAETLGATYAVAVGAAAVGTTGTLTPYSGFTIAVYTALGCATDVTMDGAGDGTEATVRTGADATTGMDPESPAATGCAATGTANDADNAGEGTADAGTAPCAAAGAAAIPCPASAMNTLVSATEAAGAAV